MKRILCVVIALLVILCVSAFAEEACEHSWKIDVKSQATCSSPKIMYEYCTKCGDVNEDWPEGSTLPHDYKVVEDKNVPCNDSYRMQEVCQKCGRVNDHWGIDHSYTIRDKVPATCTQKAVKEEYCTKCGKVNETWEDTDGGYAPHQYEEKTIAATCTTDGKTFKACKVCGHITDEVVIPAFGHSTVVLPAVAPTCTNTGLTEGSKCTVCGETVVAQNVIPANGHSYVNTVVVVATCTVPEETKDICSVCHDQTNHVVGAALGHDYNSYDVEPTEYKRGYTVNYCTRDNCDYSYRSNYVDKLIPETLDVDAVLAPYGSIVTDLDDNDKPYTVEIDEETKHVCIIATAEEDGTFPLRELHLSLDLISELKEEGFVEICFIVDDAELVVPFAVLETEIMVTVKNNFPATLTGFIFTLDTNAVNEEGVEGCLVKVDMSADTEEVDGIEMEITDVISGMSLLLGETMLVVAGGAVYTAA